MRVLSIATLTTAVLASSANAAIALGHNGTNHLIWVEGKGSCTGKILAPIADSRCGPAITLDNGDTYTVQGCPNNLKVVGDGNDFSGACYQLKVAKQEKCGVHTHVCGAKHPKDGKWEDNNQ